MIKVGIVGSDGYSVGELYHLLNQHPDVELRLLYSKKHNGMSVADIFQDMHTEEQRFFTDQADFDDLDVLFICLKSGLSKEFWDAHKVPEGLKVIDFSQEARFISSEGDQPFTYGLPEANRRLLTQSTFASVPGSFALATTTPLIPLAKHLMLNSTIHTYSVAGKTEHYARTSIDATMNYETIFDNFHVVEPLSHPHSEEVKLALQSMQSSFDQKVNLIPLQGTFNRGIYTVTYFKSPADIDSIKALYEEYFHDHSFVRIVDSYPDVRDAVNTNMLYIHLSKKGEKLLVVSTLDNLLKASAGTAVHIMNLMCGLVETTGLQTKPTIF